MKREEFEDEDDQFHAMIMRYEWKHYWKSWELKMKSIFGTKEEDNVVEDGEYSWEPGESLKRLDDPNFKENVKSL